MINCQDAIESRKEAECRILEIERRADKAEKELVEDRKKMEEEVREREQRMTGMVDMLGSSRIVQGRGLRLD